MEYDHNTINRFKKVLKEITKDDNWFYFVIKFSPNSKYNFQKQKGQRIKEWKFQHLNKISSDIKKQLDLILPRVIKVENNTSSMKYKWFPTNPCLFDEDPNLIFIEKLQKDDLNYLGCIETSELFNRKNKLDLSLPNDLHLDLHLHLFIRNTTNLSPNQIIFELMSGIDRDRSKLYATWQKNICSVSNPKTIYDIIDLGTFSNYHTKQIYEPSSVISSYWK